MTKDNDHLPSATDLPDPRHPARPPAVRQDIGLARLHQLPHYFWRFDSAHILAPAHSVQWLILSDKKWTT